MAKEKDEQEETLDKKGDKKAEEKPKLKPGELSFMQIIIIVGGTVVLMFVLFLVGYLMIIKPDLEKLNAGDNKDAKGKPGAVAQDASKEGEKVTGLDKEENERFISTGRITTNPKMSPQFVIVDIALDFFVNDDQSKEIKKEKTEESSALHKPMAEVKGEVNNLLGSYTVADLQTMQRDSLQMLFKNKLKNVFTKNKMALKDAILQEFIIQ
ncbi:MAG: flagellar basal body-associated FliL family protein [FCB group bacterium]|jgi:flagellar basal body-associated protein FliL